jgi:hypothetical protein
MNDHAEISRNAGLPEPTFSILAVVETTKADLRVIAGEAADQDAVLGSGFRLDQSFQTIHHLIEAGVLRLVTTVDQTMIRREILRPDIYTYASLSGVDIPPVGALEFTPHGARIWMKMLATTAHHSRPLGPAMIHSCHRFSESTGRILRLLLAASADDLVDANLIHTRNGAGMGSTAGTREICRGSANVPWRYYWWSEPTRCWYRLTLADVDPMIYWPRQGPLHPGYQDIERFGWTMSLGWNLSSFVYDMNP